MEHRAVVGSHILLNMAERREGRALVGRHKRLETEGVKVVTALVGSNKLLDRAERSGHWGAST